MLKSNIFPALLVACGVLTGVLNYLYEPDAKEEKLPTLVIPEKKKVLSAEDIQAREAIAGEMRSKFPAHAVVLRSTPAAQLPEGHVSCLGRVTWQLPGEDWPTDAQGKRLEPLATLFVPDMPGVPEALRQVALITIFAPEEGWAENPDEKPQLGCVIRVYPTLEGLVPCDYASQVWKTCILTPEAVAHDMPKWPDCGGDERLWSRFLSMETIIDIDDYHKDICSAVYETILKEKFPAAFDASAPAVYETHKIGGYPTYAQGAPDIPASYPFVMQINFDSDADLNIGDCGSYYFYYNADKNDWRVYSDCY